MLAALRAAGHEVYDFRNPDNEHSSALAHGFNMPDGTLPAMASADCKCEHSSALAHGFKWTNVDPNCWEWTAEEYKANLTHPLAEKQFENDLRALEMCDTCVLVLPCGRSAHTEAGWMAGKGRRVMVLITDQDSFEAELMYKLFDDVCISTEELLEKLNPNDNPNVD